MVISYVEFGSNSQGQAHGIGEYWWMDGDHYKGKKKK